jgi:hypothetical protein
MAKAHSFAVTGPHCSTHATPSGCAVYDKRLNNRFGRLIQCWPRIHVTQGNNAATIFSDEQCMVSSP